MPGQLRNRNATRHGLRAGRLPKGAAYIRRDTDGLRTTIENAVAELHGGNVSLFQAALVQSVIRWERHAMLAQRWLRLEFESMDLATRLSFSREIARASTERDKCLKELGLDRTANDDLFGQLYSPQATIQEPAPREETTAEDPGEGREELPELTTPSEPAFALVVADVPAVDPETVVEPEAESITAPEPEAATKEILPDFQGG